jgi:biofilm protein TabA
MIVDTLDHIRQYADLDPALGAGLEYLYKAAASGLADGKYPIDGERLRASVSSYRTKEPGAVPFEAHRRYVDIQYMLSGSETMYWMPREGCAVREEYSADKDIELLADGPASALIAKPGVFLVFFPQDAHKPGCFAARQEDVRKLVIKVRVT